MADKSETHNIPEELEKKITRREAIKRLALGMASLTIAPLISGCAAIVGTGKFSPTYNSTGYNSFYNSYNSLYYSYNSYNSYSSYSYNSFYCSGGGGQLICMPSYISYSSYYYSYRSYSSYYSYYVPYYSYYNSYRSYYVPYYSYRSYF
ncbi:MAG: hypothetical protein V2A53_09385 [bacterium]